MLLLDYPEPPLGDGVVVLRPWALTDLACIERAARDPRIPRGTTVPAVYSDDAGRAFVERQWRRRTDGEGISLAIARAGTGEAVGLVVLLFRDSPRTAGIGYWVIPAARGRGSARRAVGLASRWALTGAGLARVEALVEPDNAPSRRVLERSGFALEGRLRSYAEWDGERVDMLLYSLIAADLA